MYGYLIAETSSLDEAEKERYQAVYCGLCLDIRDRYGQLARANLAYDMLFLLLLLASLYEPKETTKIARCPVHPAKPKQILRSKLGEYVADITLALAYHKCLDDWNDDKKTSAKVWARAMQKPYEIAASRIPNQCKAIESGLMQISELERMASPDPDAAAALFGTIMAELFCPREDEWSRALRAFGDRLGRFIYLMDALCDMDEDAKKKSYNPLLAANISRESAMKPIMSHIGMATEIFEKLPLEQDLHIMRSVLYSGVWIKYNNLMEKSKKKRQKNQREKIRENQQKKIEGEQRANG